MNDGEKSLTVCVPPEAAQVVRKVLEENKLWDCSRKLQRNGESVAIPILNHNRSQMSTLLQDYPGAVIKELCLPSSAKSIKKTEGQKLKEEINNLLINNKLSVDLLSEVPRKWERHGDLIILPSSAFASPAWGQLGDELWQTVAAVLSCSRLARHWTVANDGFRTPQVTLLLGNDGNVVHIDNGIKYSFDVTKCMFSSGNISEKLRVASWDCSNETVVDLYAGIGYFTLPYLVHARACHVHACEWNPDAVEALRESLVLNGVEDRCTVHQGDNRQLQLSCVADRVNLGLIPSSEDGWRVAARVLKSTGGVLHIHHNVTISSASTAHACTINHLNHHGQQQDMAENEQSVTSNSDHKVGIQNNGNLSLHSTGDSSENSRMEENYETSHSQCNDDECDRDSRDSVYNTKSQSEWVLDSHGVKAKRKQIKYLPWANEACERIQCLLKEEKGGSVWQCQIIHIEKIKSYAPHIDHVVLDLECKLKDGG